MTTKRLLPVAALSACGLAAAATTLNALTPGLPAAVDYTLGYAPWWVGLTGATLGAAAVVVGLRPSVDDDRADARPESGAPAPTGPRPTHHAPADRPPPPSDAGTRPGTDASPAATATVEPRRPDHEPATVPLARPWSRADRPGDPAVVEPAGLPVAGGTTGPVPSPGTGIVLPPDGAAAPPPRHGDRGTASGSRPGHGRPAAIGQRPGSDTGAPASPGGPAVAEPGGPSKSRSPGFAVGGVAGIVLLWASAGVVLDGFRSFFAVTGIPAGDFAVVDRFGFAARFGCLVAAALVVAAVVRRRADGDGCRDCGRIPGERLGRARPGLVALSLMWPYPLLKTYWWLGGGLARPTGFDEGLPAGELLAAGAGTVLFLAMTFAWWRRGGLRWATLAAGWVAVGVLLSMGALSFFGTASQLLGLTDGPVDFGSGVAMVMVGSVYGSWSALGIAVTVLTWRYQRSTRPVCAAGCSR